MLKPHRKLKYPKTGHLRSRVTDVARIPVRRYTGSRSQKKRAKTDQKVRKRKLTNPISLLTLCIIEKCLKHRLK